MIDSEKLESISASQFKSQWAKEKEKVARNETDDLVEDDALVQIYKNWLKDGNSFSPVGDVSIEGKLKKSAYKVRLTMQGLFFDRIKPKTAELYKFKSGPMEEILSEIDRFWGLEADYQKLGLLYCRGMLMYGPPGSGKTSIINQVVDMITARGDVVFYADNLNALKEGLKAFRSVEPERKLVVILEDADEHLRYDEQAFLHLLDGQDSTDGVVYLASTNYIDRFPTRALRSGRFDKKIEVPQPPREGRLAYLKNKLKPAEMETDAEIERLADETDGMSFGDLLELVTAVYALKEPTDDVLARLKEGIEKPKGESEEKESSVIRFLLPQSATVRAGCNLDLNMVKEAIKKK